MKEQITFDDFDKVDIRVGTVISVKKNSIFIKTSFNRSLKIHNLVYHFNKNIQY